jgi:hydrogenase nickel incorporation protein HypA/HybF
MHELSISEAVLDTALRHAAGRRVTAVDLTVGALRQVVPESLEFYFEIVTRDTPCEGAVLHQHLVAARARCTGCAHEWPLDFPAFRCAECGGVAEVLSGEELEVESIDVEEMECTAAR